MTATVTPSAILRVTRRTSNPAGPEVTMRSRLPALLSTPILLAAACAGPAATGAAAPRQAPAAATFTTAPLRHRLRLELHAPVEAVWAVVGDHSRLPEYTAGIARVEVTAAPAARVCHFRPREAGGEELALRELVRWEEAGVGYATSGEPGNPFGIERDLSLVTVAPSPAGGTIFTWDQHYDGADLPAMRAEFDPAFADIGRRLVARFGGRVLERWMDAAR